MALVLSHVPASYYYDSHTVHINLYFLHTLKMSNMHDKIICPFNYARYPYNNASQAHPQSNVQAYDFYLVTILNPTP
jgi:hypothetical protein